MSALWQEESFDDSDPRKVVHLRELPLEGTFERGWLDKEIKSAQGLREAIVAAGGPVPLGIKVFIDPATKKPVADKPYANVMFHSEADAKAFLALGNKDSRVKLLGHKCTMLRHNGGAGGGSTTVSGAAFGVWDTSASAQPAAGGKQYVDADEDPSFVHDERTLYVSGIPVRATDGAYIRSRGELKKQIEAQSQPGSVHSVKIFRDENGTYSGVALVTMVDSHCANKLKKLHIGQKSVTVKLADRPPAPQPQPQAQNQHQHQAGHPKKEAKGAPGSTGQGKHPGGGHNGPAQVRVGDVEQDLQRGLMTWRHSKSCVLKRQLMPVSGQGEEARFSGTAGGGNGFPPADSFTILSWNVLFSEYAKNHTYCKAEHLDFEYRLGLMRGCIQSHKPDLLALQEIETADPNLKKLIDMLRGEGYRFAHLPKREGATITDGMMIGWQSERFALPQGSGDKFLNFDCGLACKLETLDPPGHSVVVCSTHLKAGASEEDRRITQMMTMLGRVADFWPNTPTVVAGDLNSEPEWNLVPQLLAGSPIGPLRSAYADRSCFTDRPFTTYSWFVQAVMDYVLFTPQTLTPLEVLKIPGVRDVVQTCEEDYPDPPSRPVFRMLPTKSFPSDHLPLFCRISFQRERDSVKSKTHFVDSSSPTFRTGAPPPKSAAGPVKQSGKPPQGGRDASDEGQGWQEPPRARYSEEPPRARYSEEPPRARYSEDGFYSGPKVEKRSPQPEQFIGKDEGFGERRPHSPEQPETQTASPQASFARGSTLREVDSKTDDL
jgi:mRNA deadenylase 3'-5' endonuclease subunit Ccr4